MMDLFIRLRFITLLSMVWLKRKRHMERMTMEDELRSNAVPLYCAQWYNASRVMVNISVWLIWPATNPKCNN